MSTVVKDLGPVTAYAYAVAGGYTGTEEEFIELLGDLAATVADLESLTVTVTTLTPGSSATASYEDGVLALGIPQGAKGDTGTAATIAVGTVTTVAPTQNASVTNTGSSSAAVFAFSIPRGDGVATVTKTGTSGNVDTYTMTSDRGVTLGTFTVTNGNVSSVNGKTGAVVLDAGDLGYDSSETYTSGSVGAAVSDLKSQIDDIEEEVKDLADAVFSGNSWGAVQELVDAGEAANVLQIGDQIADTWEKAAGNSYVAPWDVVHHFPNGDMALCWHYAYPDGINFDAPEAIYYAPEGGLEAGTYYISIAYKYGGGWLAGNKIYFTLTSAMDADDQLVIDCGKDAKNDPANGRTWKVFAKGSTTVKQSGTTAASGTGTELGSTSDVNPHRTNGQINAPSRCVYGYGRYSQSAIRQWLNSSAAANAWWAPQNPWDRPSEQLNMRGFLGGCSQEFLSILQTVDVVTALNTQEGFAEDTETTQDKIFLPSLQEWYITPQLADAEGEDWDLYKAYAAEAGLSGKFAQYGTYEILKKYNVSNKSAAVTVWLRSANRGYASNAWSVNYSGSVYYYDAYFANRGCPACIIKKST